MKSSNAWRTLPTTSNPCKRSNAFAQVPSIKRSPGTSTHLCPLLRNVRRIVGKPFRISRSPLLLRSFDSVDTALHAASTALRMTRICLIPTVLALSVRLRDRLRNLGYRCRLRLPRVHYCDRDDVDDFLHFSAAGQQMHGPRHAHEDGTKDLSSSDRS